MLTDFLTGSVPSITPTTAFLFTTGVRHLVFLQYGLWPNVASEDRST